MVDDALDGLVVGDETHHERAVEEDAREGGGDDVDVDVGRDLAPVDRPLVDVARDLDLRRDEGLPEGVERTPPKVLVVVPEERRAQQRQPADPLGVEQRQDKRPQLSDLRESGSIEQDSDIVIFLYRDVVYNEATEFPARADLLVSKHRNGPTGTVSLHFEKSLTKFSDARTQMIDLSAL